MPERVTVLVISTRLSRSVQCHDGNGAVMLDDFPIGTLTTRHRNGVDAQRDDRAGVDRLGAEGVDSCRPGSLMCG